MKKTRCHAWNGPTRSGSGWTASAETLAQAWESGA